MTDKWRRELHKPNLHFYRMLLKAVNGIRGAFIELGVGDGETFSEIYTNYSYNDSTPNFHCRSIIGVDTFEGMPYSDEPGDEMYPEGTLKGPSIAEFRDKYEEAFLVKGVIPDVLDNIIGTTNKYGGEILETTPFAFCHIDLDHRNSTKAALEWVWPRMSDGGILVCHDFRWDIKVRVSGAIQDWMQENDIVHIGLCDLSIWFQKGVS